MTSLRTAAILLLLPMAIAALAPSPDVEAPDLVARAVDLGIDFDRRQSTDALGRTITWYLRGLEPRDSAPALPLVLWIQGSGGQSLFRRRGSEADAPIGAGVLDLLAEVVDDRALLLAVEKPGVAFLDDLERPGTAAGTNEEFRREHTLERWTIALAAALDAAGRRPDVDPTRVLVLGHSEGAATAARLAAERADAVSHVGFLAGNGLTRGFCLVRRADRRRGPDDTAERRHARVEAMHATISDLLARPDDIDDLVMGHPPRRWASFLRASARDDLLRTEAPVMLVHGTADRSSPIESFDALRAELRRLDRPHVLARRLADADHAFDRPGDPPGAGFRRVLVECVDWFLAD